MDVSNLFYSYNKNQIFYIHGLCNLFAPKSSNYLGNFQKMKAGVMGIIPLGNVRPNIDMEKTGRPLSAYLSFSIWGRHPWVTEDPLQPPASASDAEAWCLCFQCSQFLHLSDSPSLYSCVSRAHHPQGQPDVPTSVLMPSGQQPLSTLDGSHIATCPSNIKRLLKPKYSTQTSR